jgi:hypothetical protein
MKYYGFFMVRVPFTTEPRSVKTTYNTSGNVTLLNPKMLTPHIIILSRIVAGARLRKSPCGLNGLHTNGIWR